MALNITTPEQEALITAMLKQELAAKKLRINQLFMANGPGPMWDAWKERNKKEYDHIEMICAVLGVEPW